MPYRRRKNVNYRRNRRMKRYKGSLYRKRSSNFVSFKQVYEPTAVSTSSVASQDGGFYLRLNDMPAPTVTAIKGMFDAYRFAHVTWKVFQLGTTAITQGIANTVSVETAVPMPIIYTAIDYNSVNGPALAVDIMAYSSCKRATPNTLGELRSLRQSYKPKIAVQAFATSPSSGYMEKASPWLNTAYGNVEHYGIVYFIDPSTGNGYFSFQFSADVIIQCKNVI